MIGWSWKKSASKVEAIGVGNGVAQSKFWLGVDVHGVEVRADVVSSGWSTFSDIFAWIF